MRAVRLIVLSACMGLGLTAFCDGARATSERLLYQFYNRSNPTHGIYPIGIVAGADGTLYGLTDDNLRYGNSSGVIFKLSPPAAGSEQWTQTVLHRFASDGSEGLGPQTLGIDSDGALFGLTAYGGSFNNGVVFKLSPPSAGQGTWSYSVLYSFPEFISRSDLIKVGGNYYGTTSSGGGGTGCTEFVGFQTCGTIYQLSPPKDSSSTTWTRRVYDLPGGLRGSYPTSLIADDKGHLFGSTRGDYGHLKASPGTIFRIAPPTATTDWSMAVLARFGDEYVASSPEIFFSGLTGTLYGTTEVSSCYGSQGPCHSNCPEASSTCQDVFVLKQPAPGGSSWQYQEIHLSADYNLDINYMLLGKPGVIYGYSSEGDHCGTVIELTAPSQGQSSWSESYLYLMKGKPDDGCKIAGLVRGLGSNLFGVTTYGGKFAPGGFPDGGLGTVFEITP